MTFSVSSYDKLLLDLANDLKKEECEKVAFICDMPAGKWENVKKSPIGVLKFMEEQEYLSRTNVSDLQKILEGISRNDLASKVEKYEAETNKDHQGDVNALTSEFSAIQCSSNQQVIEQASA